MHEESHDRTSAAQLRDVGRGLRFLVAALIVAALVAVALDNRHDVRLGYVTGDAQAPVWIVVAAAGVAGVVIGWLLKHRPARHTRR